MANWFAYDSVQKKLYFQNEQIVQEAGNESHMAYVKIQNKTTGINLSYEYKMNWELRRQQFQPKGDMMPGIYAVTLRIAEKEKKCMFVMKPSAENDRYRVQILLKHNVREGRMKMHIMPEFHGAPAHAALYLPENTLQYHVNGCPVSIWLPRLENHKHYYYVIQEPQDSKLTFQLVPVPVPPDVEAFSQNTDFLQQTDVIRLEIQEQGNHSAHENY